MKKIYAMFTFLMLGFMAFFLFGCDSNEQIETEEAGIDLFSDGLLAVKKDGKWGYVNQQNEVIIDFLFDKAGAFYQESAHVVLLNEKEEHFLIDKEGNELLSKRYDALFRDEETDLIWFYEDGKLGLMDHDEQKFDEPFSSSPVYTNHNLYGRFPFFRDGIAFVRDLDAGFRLLKQDGTWLNEKRYIGGVLFAFSNGYAWLKEEGQENYHCIDKQGKVLFESEHEMQTPFNANGLAVIRVTLEGTPYYRIIDTKGNKVHGDIHSIGMSYIQPVGNLYVVSIDYEGGTNYLLDKSGKKIRGSDSTFIRLLSNHYKSEHGIIHLEYIVSDSHVYDGNGNKVLDHATNTTDIEYHYAINEKNELFSYRNNQLLNAVEWHFEEKLVSVPNSLWVRQVYQDSLIVASLDSLGVYNLQGTQLIDESFKHLKFYFDGYLLARSEDNLYGVFDKDGNEVLPGIYSEVNLKKGAQ